MPVQEQSTIKLDPHRLYAINYRIASSIINLATTYNFVTNKTQTSLSELFTIKGYVLKHTIIITFCKQALQEVSSFTMMRIDDIQEKVPHVTRAPRT